LHQLKADTAECGSAEELAAAKKEAAAAREAAETATRDSLKHRGLLEIATAQADALALKHKVSAKEVELLKEQHRELATVC